MTAHVYKNADGETFYRESDTSGHIGEQEVEFSSKEALDEWLARCGWELVAYEYGHVRD